MGVDEWVSSGPAARAASVDALAIQRKAVVPGARALLTAVWGGLMLLGALPALARLPTLVDRLTGTRVLVDVR